MQTLCSVVYLPYFIQLCIYPLTNFTEHLFCAILLGTAVDKIDEIPALLELTFQSARETVIKGRV